ncbi:hypothetical protein Nepgr_002598 [Nepenthes gracilis]|uniref:Uncharacterized protein n=1 Tax=Nepenthes gracilis TaxID=150966 RepID=A0AAD3P9U1_NEPGR|nr:hypothetical protein Nepgr_002598 [Nepenthes gracilis]
MQVFDLEAAVGPGLYVVVDFLSVCFASEWSCLGSRCTGCPDAAGVTYLCCFSNLFSLCRVHNQGCQCCQQAHIYSKALSCCSGVSGLLQWKTAVLTLDFSAALMIAGFEVLQRKCSLLRVFMMLCFQIFSLMSAAVGIWFSMAVDAEYGFGGLLWLKSSSSCCCSLVWADMVSPDVGQNPKGQQQEIASKQPSRPLSTISLRPSTTDKKNCKIKDREHQQPNQQNHRSLHYGSQQTASCNSMLHSPNQYSSKQTSRRTVPLVSKIPAHASAHCHTAATPTQDSSSLQEQRELLHQ